MKKLFSFAVALVACALAFTSCGTKIDSPLVGWWRAATMIVDVNPDGSSTERAGSNELNFIDNGTFQQNMYYEGTFDGYFAKGSWSVNGDKVTISKKTSGKISDKNFINDNSFKPYEEVYTWSIDGHYLHLKTADGEEYEFRDGKP